jgi:hypothetical protein
MKKILYLISKQPDKDIADILSTPIPSEHSVSAILLQQGTRTDLHVPFSCFVLENDISTDDLDPSYSKIKYSDMVQMIFDADSVISI